MPAEIIKNDSGLLLCSKYAFMPNKLKYCGPSNERTLFDYTAKKKIDQGLIELLSDFECLYPYLKGIARANKIKDSFNERVVEAYWLGNSLLNNVLINDLFLNLKEEHHLAKRLPKKYFKRIVSKIPVGAKPHHSFQVLNVFIETGKRDFSEVVETMGNCLILPGRVKKIKGEFAWVELRGLFCQNHQLFFNQPQIKKARFKFFGQAFIDNLKSGDLVSIHWGFVCDKLTVNQAERLKAWNQYHLNLANLTI